MNYQLIIQIFIVFAGAYLIGAIPFGAIAGALNGVDLTKIGSGSTGTTNVIRAVGLVPGLFVLGADIGKGACAAYLGMYFLHEPIFVIAAGITAMIGHVFSVFLKFKGGKAAAAGVGVLLVINWKVFLAVAAIVFITLIVTRYQSAASLLGSAAAPFLLWFFKADSAYITVSLFGVAFIWVKHIPNIKRLLNGTENKIGKKIKKKK